MSNRAEAASTIILIAVIAALITMAISAVFTRSRDIPDPVPRTLTLTPGTIDNESTLWLPGDTWDKFECSEHGEVDTLSFYLDDGSLKSYCCECVEDFFDDAGVPSVIHTRDE